MITVVDYGMGNLRSVAKAFEAVGANIKVSSKPEDIKNSKAIVVPGVGAFKDAIKHLKELNLYDEIINHINNKKPYFGICLGLQILFEKGYEFGEHRGLGIIKGKVIRFTQKEGYKIPHMGWNQVNIKQKNGLFKNIKNSEFFYFVHSFYVVPEDSKVIASTTDYINEFCSSIQIDNIWAVQFHPEKSQKPGLKLIKNFVKKVNTL
ncbi:MAG TPA: imidazole glycerol phosphate synthase subunit HisH [Persephonella sp.]|nr:imidazole glycerol phosphate synthase subunit HisH [Hydrogenothermaceae bacterium]HIQ24467.1 imidazole glycerol phosphate synthase subunit HisH [Persephonella sp.]